MSKQILQAASAMLLAGSLIIPAHAAGEKNSDSAPVSGKSVELAHAGTGHSSHRHCHNRVRRGKVIKVCHSHSHRVLHHL